MAKDVFGSESGENRVKLPPIQHENIPDNLLSRIEKIYRPIADLLKTTLEQWEISFMRTKEIKKGISNWEALIETLNETIKTQDLYKKSGVKKVALNKKEKRKLIFNVLAFYLGGALTKEQLEEKWVSNILSVFEKKMVKNK